LRRFFSTTFEKEIGNTNNLIDDELREFREDSEVRLETEISDFPEQICQVMDRDGISRSDLAKTLRKNKSYVSRVLNRHVNLTLRTMQQFAEAVGQELNLRLSDTGQTRKMSPQHPEVQQNQEALEYIGDVARSELENISLLRGVALESIQDLLQDCRVQELKKGSVLINAGQPNHFLYLLLSGRLRIHLKLEIDPLTVLEPGEVVGELSLIDGQPASAYVVADDDCRLLVLDEKTFWALTMSSPATARNLLLVLSQRLRYGNSIIALSEKITEEELEAFESDDFRASETSLLDRKETGNEALRLYRQTIAYLWESMRRAEERENPDIGQGEQLVKLMIDSIVNESALLLLATDRRQPFTIGNHCVNVAIVALRIAQTLEYDLQRQTRVGLAALLHEIGMVKVTDQMVQEQGKSAARQRPIYSAEILEKLGSEYSWLAETVRQVYEREDGSGFPFGLTGEDIHEEAKVLGIADVFEACIHERPYRGALTGRQLFDELTARETKTFSDHLVKAILKSFSLYPYNEYVILNTGEVGQVVEVNPENLARPMVKILCNSEGEPLGEPREVDLAQDSSVIITKAITYDMLPGAR